MAKPLTSEKKWALILGGSSGLGLATAIKLASEGFNICIVHRNRKSNIPQFVHKDQLPAFFKYPKTSLDTYSPQTLWLGKVFFSITATGTFCLDKCIAQVKPAKPPPIISTSKVFFK